MKSMFSMSFTADPFGARLPSPMLGQVTLRGMSRGMGQQGATADQLLASLQQADNQVAAAQNYVSAHPNLQQDLGADFPAFQQALAQTSNYSTVDIEAQLQASQAGTPLQISQGDYSDINTYVNAAATLAAITARHPAVSAAVPTTPGTPAPVMAPTTPGYKVPAQAPGTKPASAAAAKSDLTAPLLVGGGVLAIGLVALLARA
jgi:hypothetical protein